MKFERQRRSVVEKSVMLTFSEKTAASYRVTLILQEEKKLFFSPYPSRGHFSFSTAKTFYACRFFHVFFFADHAAVLMVMQYDFALTNRREC